MHWWRATPVSNDMLLTVIRLRRVLGFNLNQPLTAAFFFRTTGKDEFHDGCADDITAYHSAPSADQPDRALRRFANGYRVSRARTFA